MANDLLSVNIIAKDKLVLHEDVKAISAYNERGVFDILAEHTNFITVIKDKVVIHKANGQDKEVPIDNGVLRVNKNRVDIYIGLLNIKQVPLQ